SPRQSGYHGSSDAINATRKDSVNNCGEPLNCPFNIMVTVRAKLNFGRIDPDLEPERRPPLGEISTRGHQHDEEHYRAQKSTPPPNVEHAHELYRRGCENRT